MISNILSRDDIAFLLYEWLDVEHLTSRARFSEHSRETFDAVLDISERIATNFFAPHNRKADLEGAWIENGRVQVVPEAAKAIAAFCEAGLMAASHDFEKGGMQLPAVVEKASTAWFYAANMASSSFILLTQAASNLILAHASKEISDRYVPPMLDGRFFGTMCLSEPHAGSSLAEIRTRAVPQEDGSYRIVGNKMWISAADHNLGENVIHLVLAKLPGSPPGVKGISLFLVPRLLLNQDGKSGEPNDIAIAGLNHKMGTRGTPNCLVNFGEGQYRPGGSAGAVGWLVGEINGGLTAMFHMMNEARISVGLTAAAVGCTAYLHALDYARLRPQGYRLGKRGKDAKQVAIVEHADVRRMLLAQKSYAEGGLAFNLYCARLLDEERSGADEATRREAHLLLELLTPMAKSWPSQWSQEVCSHAIQIHGGAGYTVDYPVEQFYRDNRLNPIHEGTQGIQGLDLLGRKVAMHGGEALILLLARMRGTIALSERNGGLQEFAGALERRVVRLEEVTATLLSEPDPSIRMGNSNAYLEAFGHIVVAWLWLDMMRVATSDSPFQRGKRQAGQYFLRWELPKVDAPLDLLAKFDDTTITMPIECF